MLCCKLPSCRISTNLHDLCWFVIYQIFIYVHQKATVIDTTMTEVPADQRTIQEFELSTKSYVQNYWFSLQWICLNTPPGEICPLDKLTKKKS